jgi:hypothetical protein
MPSVGKAKGFLVLKQVVHTVANDPTQTLEPPDRNFLLRVSE